ncbi:MAG TPA: hypothetical protein VNW92_09100 [Polyangiaceae bacterium]|jgi:hypothetical protein|nr:hypothetical protein [Polyangiaceae bacterium]
MDRERITLTRDGLYHQVWKTPMSRLAAEFGISDVALAKICKKLDVPIPGRGYWARVTNGQKVKQPKLPKARAGARAEYTLAKHEPRVATAAVEVPEVKISDSLVSAHAATRRLSAVLDGREPGHRKTNYLSGDSEATVRVSDGTKRRALLVLDALLKALEGRGHTIQLEVPRETWGIFNLSVKVGSETLKLYIAEPQIRNDHQLTPKEQADQLRYGSTFAPKYDLTQSGRLSLRARAYFAIHRSWSDGATRRLEDILGKAVLGIEELGRAAAEYRAEIHEASRQREIEERRRQSRTVLSHYEEALGCHLEQAVEDLRRADAIRELLRAVAATAVPREKAEAVEAWIDWAARWADSIDPRADPVSAARVVIPDVSRMSENEFSYWRDWPKSAERVESGYGQAFEPWGV